MGKTAVSEAKREAYERLLSTHPEVSLKGKNMLYTSINGHMFTVFSSDATLGIRIPAFPLRCEARSWPSTERVCWSPTVP